MMEKKDKMVDTTKQAFSETYDIISHMEENLYNKIPRKFVEMLKNNRDLRV